MVERSNRLETPLIVEKAISELEHRKLLRERELSLLRQLE
jgi:hypothetical protein